MDASQIETLCAELGIPAAEDVVCRAMEELGTRLCLVHDLYQAGNRAEMQTSLRRIRAIAAQLGLQSVSRIAGDVLTCMDDCDRVAEAACMARLVRMGERSLAALWDLQDMRL